MKNNVIIVISIIVCFSAKAQEPYMTGLLPDDGTYELLPRKSELITRDYEILPSKYSLFQYCPTAKSQSRYGTCTSWATAYAARTIAEAVKNEWKDKKKINQEAFSPLFVYALIKEKSFYFDDDCQRGTYIYKALELMKRRGVPKLSLFNVLCANNISENLLSTASQYKIDDYFTLFSIEHADANEKIRKVKKSLSENCPVVIAMWIPKSFHYSGSTWNGLDVDPSKHGYHAMCVVGYDDKKNGGSFHIMNSWGESWGEKGFVWVKYDDFSKYVDQAYEIYVRKTNKPTPKPEPKVVNSLGGEIDLQLATGERMVPILETKDGLYRYKINDAYIGGTLYRIYISNNEPAYVYVISSDLTNKVNKLFPPEENISPALTYKYNHIAIPDETYYEQMDETKGTDYMCVLYSKEALNINNIIDKIKSSKGSFYEKVKFSILDKVIQTKDVTFKKNKISFSAMSEKTVVPVFVEIRHR